MLKVEGIDVFYGQVQALRDVSIAVEAGEIVALFGANGAGKTTTLRAISGLARLGGGRVTLDDTSLAGKTPEQIAGLGVAHIPEGRGIFPGLTVWHNLKMGAYVHRLPAEQLTAAAEEVLSIFPRLRERLRQTAGTMSGGEQQMLAIARALMSKPRLLMLDEPSHGLAPVIVEEVFGLLGRLREQGTAMLIVEQYATVALSVVERGYVLERGRVALEGDAAQLRRDFQRLAGAYLGAVT